MPPRDRPSLAAATRLSVSGLVESLHAFLAWNLVLLLAVAAAVLLLSLSALAILVVPLLAPLACGLVRLAVVAARDEHVALRTALPGIRHRWMAKFGVAALQCAVLLLALLNLLLAPSIGGLLAAISLAMSVYLIATVLAYATALWPLVCDPRREDAPLSALARLALVVLFRKPFQLLFLVLAGVLAAIVIRNLIVPAFFLPSMAVLLMAGYVIPAADEIAPVEAADR